MINRIKERVKAWKRLFTQDSDVLNENSTCREIIMELGYYSSGPFYSSAHQKMWEAIKTIGLISREEQKFLETLPAYITVRCYLAYDDSREDFTNIVNGAEVVSTCSAKNDDIPIREYAIITDREELWGLEIYIFRDSRFCRGKRHGIIRYVKERPTD